MISIITITLFAVLQDVDLAYETHQWPDQILVKVEIIVRHIRW